MGPYRILRDFDPLRVQIQLGECTDEQFREFLAEQDELIAEAERALAGIGREPIVLIIDASCDIIPPPTQRKLQAEWLDRNRDAVQAATLGSFVVVPNPLKRAALSALFWLVRPPIAIEPVDTLETAVERALSLLRRQGCAPPPALSQHGATPVLAAIERARQLAA